MTELSDRWAIEEAEIPASGADELGPPLTVSPPPSFRVVVRGYDRRQVERFVERQAGLMARLAARVTALEQELFERDPARGLARRAARDGASGARAAVGSTPGVVPLRSMQPLVALVPPPEVPERRRRRSRRRAVRVDGGSATPVIVTLVLVELAVLASFERWHVDVNILRSCLAGGTAAIALLVLERRWSRRAAPSASLWRVLAPLVVTTLVAVACAVAPAL